ncbi:hypothetical protein BHE74_00014098 [Ensete ventricosum]|nr:hypothetical protein BHE74_00014098 [Ensete ventricosum]
MPHRNFQVLSFCPWSKWTNVLRGERVDKSPEQRPELAIVSYQEQSLEKNHHKQEASHSTDLGENVEGENDPNNAIFTAVLFVFFLLPSTPSSFARGRESPRKSTNRQKIKIDGENTERERERERERDGDVNSGASRGESRERCELGSVGRRGIGK